MNAKTYPHAEQNSIVAAPQHPLLSSPTLYERTGAILDINTLLVNRGELRAALAAATPAGYLVAGDHKNAVFITTIRDEAERVAADRGVPMIELIRATGAPISTSQRDSIQDVADAQHTQVPVTQKENAADSRSSDGAVKKIGALTLHPSSLDQLADRDATSGHSGAPNV